MDVPKSAKGDEYSTIKVGVIDAVFDWVPVMMR